MARNDAVAQTKRMCQRFKDPKTDFLVLTPEDERPGDGREVLGPRARQDRCEFGQTAAVAAGTISACRGWKKVSHSVEGVIRLRASRTLMFE